MFPHPTQQRAIAFNADARADEAQQRARLPRLPRPPKDRMVIVCCGCGGQVDLPAVSELVQTETTPHEIVYRAACLACGFTHRIRVSQ